MPGKSAPMLGTTGTCIEAEQGAEALLNPAAGER